MPWIAQQEIASERLTLVPSSPWWGEHRSRYHFAGRFMAGRTVLDIACGTGFGGPILSAAGAARVVGMDLSWDGLEEAARSGCALRDLCRADGVRLPLRDGSFEAVTSFETLEHVARSEAFVAELRRVLEPSGILVLSTPNALVTQPVDGKPRNPFHVREFTPDELRGLLGRHFGRVELLGQRPHPRFRPCPYWEPRAALPRGLGGRLRVWRWKAQCRLPAPLREGLSRRIDRRGFYPGEADFTFAREGLELAHVLVAVCYPTKER
jgi:SAM-dependent methyltransferase